MAPPPTTRNDFEIAIVCALPAEYNAVTELVDHFWEEHGYEYGKAREDANTYTTARIGNCDVVLVLLSGTGKAIAASSATSLRSSYPRIKLLLLTGICGAVPLVGTEDEILLGDVILSETLIQYDYGKRHPDTFILKDTVEESLSRPAKEVRNLVAIFKTNRALQKLQERAAFFLKQIQDKPLGEHSKTSYEYPGTTNDRLFGSDFRHKHHVSSDCLCRHCHTSSDPVCDESRTLSCEELGCNERGHVIQRPRLKVKERLELQGRNTEAQTPSIFVGRIGSGDIVLKSGEDRDRLAKLHSIIAFEMEGAGAWDELPCIVIKGVSDYADSHKNDKWQDFAAATAASTMKALLERYTPPDKPPNSSLSIHSLQMGPGMAHAERNQDRSRVPVSGISPHNITYLNTRLRRKSPRGTITDGYDASATPTALAPPPTKYIRGLPFEEISQGSESLDSSMPHTPVLTATGLAESIELQAHGDISDHDNRCLDGHRPTTSQPRDAKFNGAIDSATNQMLVEQLYFSKIDERLTHLTPAQGNTCRWFLSKSEYTDWYNNVKLHDHCGFLWVKGNPGTGKSTLMKFLFENERSKTKNDHLQILLSFFFLARGTPEEKSTVGLYRSLLHQLFQKVPSLSESLNWMTPDGARVIQRDGWSEEALKQTLKHAAKKLGDIALTMYIDALDECNDSQVTRMIRFFEELCDESVGNIKICFSSRHYPHMITTGTELTLEDEDGHKEDIQKYIKSNLKLGIKNGQTESLRSEILEKSSRIFLWVVLVIKILTELPDKSIKKMRERLQEIPTELAKLFEMILARDKKNLEEMKLCLNWVLFAIRPLKPEELYFAIQLGLDGACPAYWDRDDIDTDLMKTFVKSSSKGLVEVTRNKAGDVQFIHESVREFLLSEDGARWSGASGNLVGHGHRNLRDCCLAQINARITQHVNIPDSLPKPAETEMLRKAITSKFPFLEYSVLSILHHANRAQRAGIDQGAFLSDFPLQRWILLNNTIEKYGVRRYTQSATLLYILAERNLADLIHIHPHLDSWLDVQDERYGPPIFAARATGSHEAVQAILQAQIHEQPVGSPVRGLLESCLENADSNPTFGRDFTFLHAKGVIEHVIEQGDEVVLNFLYSLGKVDPAWRERKDRRLRMPLAWAAKNGHEGVVRFLLEKGAEVGWKARNGRTALSEGASGGHEGVVQLLLKNGAEVDLDDVKGRTPLLMASFGGHEAVVKLLLENGAEVDSRDYNGQTPLSKASSGGHEAVVKLLLENGAEVDFRDHSGQTPLLHAVLFQKKAVVKLLLENGAEIEARDKHGQTPILCAASRGDTAVFELLLENGAELEVKDNDGQTPLSRAAAGHSSNMVKLLLSDHRLNPEARDKDGQTPLLLAARTRIYYESKGLNGRTEAVYAFLRPERQLAIELLLSDSRVDPEATDKNGRTTLSWVASTGGVALVKLLLSNPRVDPEARDKNGRTPLSWAASGTLDSAVIKILLSDPRVDPEAKDKNGRTPLSWAASGNLDSVMVELLLSDPQVDPEARDENGRTPLSWAAPGSLDSAVIKILLSDPRVDPEAKDKNGRTPLSWAKQVGNDDAVRLLEDQRSSLGLGASTL